MLNEDASTTLSYYLGVFRDEQEAAARDMDEWLGKEDSTGDEQTDSGGSPEDLPVAS